MTPLEFVIQARNAEANASMDQFANKVASLKTEANDLYEGPAREMRMRTELRGLVQDIAMGQDPLQILINSLERISELGRFAFGIAGIATVGIAIDASILKAEKSFDSFSDKLMGILGVSIKNASDDALKGVIKAAQDLSDQYAKVGLIERILHGGDELKGLRVADQISAAAAQQLDQNQAARIEAHAQSLRSMTDTELARQGEITEARLAAEAKIKDARGKGDEQTAQAYEDEMNATIDRLQAKYAKEDADKHKQAVDQMDELTKAKQDAADVGKSPSEKIAELQAQRDALAARVQGRMDSGADFLPGGEDSQIQDQTAMAKLDKDIAEQTAALTKDAAEKKRAEDQKSTDAAKAAAAKTEELKRDTLRSQFDALDKEDKLVVAKQALAQLQERLAHGLGGDDALRAQKAIADLQKTIREQTGKTNPWEGVNADNALRGQMASGTYGRVVNDSAGRADAQRTEAISYLKTIAQKIGIYPDAV
jgi:hypothetical protein